MATGDQNDMAARMRAVLPAGWFPDNAPILTAILTGFGTVWAQMYAVLAWVQLQTRIATASGANLDLISLDFFGDDLPRRTGESDSAFEARIERELFRPKGTRAAVVRELTDLTGQPPRIFEPRLTSDTGGYTMGGVGYAAGGGYGSLLLPSNSLCKHISPSPRRLRTWAVTMRRRAGPAADMARARSSMPTSQARPV